MDADIARICELLGDSEPVEEQRVRDTSKINQVAIIGLSPASHDDAPWDSDWETWGLPWDSRWSEMDRLFEMHDISLVWKRPVRDYVERLQGLHKVYMQEAYWPNVTPYPLDDVIGTIGRDYFNSSIAYMLALAIHEGFERIGLWGVEMGRDFEYDYQRANCEWLIGVAESAGATVEINGPSSLMSFHSNIHFCGEEQNYQGRYGWL